MLLAQVSDPKSHRVETLLGVVVQHHLHDIFAVELANICVTQVNLKVRPRCLNASSASYLHDSRL